MIPYEFMRRLLRVEEGLNFGEFEARLREMEERIRIVGAELGGKKVAPPYNPPSARVACGFVRAGTNVSCDILQSGLMLEYGNPSYGTFGPTPLLFRTGTLTLVSLSDVVIATFSGPFWYTEPDYTPDGMATNDKIAFFMKCPSFHFIGGGGVPGEFSVHRTFGNPGHYLTDNGTDVVATTGASSISAGTTSWDSSSQCDPLDLIRANIDPLATYISVYES